ncbi:MAG TPA: NAD(P)/FAD-dependent oxidoreductase [Terriglobales bacterium]|nr:NAD(P)/FAD-dependent oxidoreductase [Terriglobales bacterium]
MQTPDLNVPMAEVYVIGSGPNGLSAAIVAASAGARVVVIEGAGEIGGGTRSAHLTLPGFVHDICSAVHPLAVGSPFFSTLPLAQHGLEWVHPEAPLAHPMDDGTAVLLERSINETALGLGPDARAYRTLMTPLVENWANLSREVLAPLRLTRRPVMLGRFGLQALRPARALAESIFSGRRARALFAGIAAHSMLPLEKVGTSGFGLVLAAAGHAVGWPVPRGGAQRIADVLARHLASLGGQVVTSTPVASLEQLPPSRVILCDFGPYQLANVAGSRLPRRFLEVLRRYRYGAAAFKVDYALREPIPWKAPECARAGTIHLGGSLEEIAAAERAVWFGRCPERPLVLVSEATRFDASRAPKGRHIAWTYCHVPHGSSVDMLSRLEAQIERFAPGFRDVVLERSIMNPEAFERHNPNLIGGDINGGAADLFQLFTRPTARLYGTPVEGLYLCSASTPPGGGVHGMCGYYATQLAMRQVFGRRITLPS